MTRTKDVTAKGPFDMEGSRAGGADAGERRTRLALLLTGVVLALIAFAIHWGGVRGEFVGADHALFLRSPLTELPTTSPSALPQWAPRAVQAVSLELDRRIWGQRPAGFRATNLALHVLATILLFAMCWRWTRRYAESAAAGLLFAVHPVHVETIALPGARGEILAAIFLLLTLVLVARSRGPLVLVAVVSYILATFASPLALALPLVLLLTDVVLPRLVVRARIADDSGVSAVSAVSSRNEIAASAGADPTQRSLWAIFGAASLPSVAAWLLVVPLHGPSNRWLTGKALLTALRELVVPFPLRVYRIFGPTAGTDALSVIALVIALGVLAGLAAIALKMSAEFLRASGNDRRSFTRLCLVGLGLAVIPVLGLVILPPPPPGPDVPFALLERFLYVPSTGACIVLAALIGMVAGLAGAAAPAARARAAVSIAAALCLPFAVLSASRLSVYRDDIAYFAAAVNEQPQSVHARVQLALAAAGHGQAARAIEILRPLMAQRAADADLHLLMGNLHRDARDLDAAETEVHEALRLNPSSAKAHLTLGLIARERSDARGAEAEYREAVRLDPNLAEAHSNLGAVLVALGSPDQALPEFRRAVELDPTLSDAAANLAHFLLNQKQPEEALAVLHTALRYSGANARLHYNLGEILRRQGDDSGAIRAYEDAIRLDPTYARPKNDLATLYAKQKRYDVAIVLLEQLLALEPDNEQAHFNLGIAYREKGDKARAAAEFAAALKIRPDYVEANRALSEMFSSGGTPPGS